MVGINQNIQYIVDKSSSIYHLKKLYIFFHKLMGDTILGHKYKKSLKKGISSLEEKNVCVENSMVKVLVENNKDCISIEVLSKDGDVIDTLIYDQNNIISEDIIGKS